MKGILYVCGTPIGNLEDISLRAIRILKEVDLIAAEDTRQTQKLLNRYHIETSLTSYHQFNESQKTTYILKLLNEGQNIAIVSKAGMPGISDPGTNLIRQFVQQGGRIITIAGPVAGVLALVSSGLKTNRFVFEGFIPRRDGERGKFLGKLVEEERTIILYEAPHRLIDTLRNIKEVFGSHRQICIARELTKKFEEIVRGSTEEILKLFEIKIPKGEITLVIEGITPKTSSTKMVDPLSLAKDLRRTSLPAREIARIVSKHSGFPKNQIYKIITKDASKANE